MGAECGCTHKCFLLFQAPSRGLTAVLLSPLLVFAGFIPRSLLPFPPRAVTFNSDSSSAPGLLSLGIPATCDPGMQPFLLDVSPSFSEGIHFNAFVWMTLVLCFLDRKQGYTPYVNGPRSPLGTTFSCIVLLHLDAGSRFLGSLCFTVAEAYLKMGHTVADRVMGVRRKGSVVIVALCRHCCNSQPASSTCSSTVSCDTVLCPVTQSRVYEGLASSCTK